MSEEKIPSSSEWDQEAVEEQRDKAWCYECEKLRKIKDSVECKFHTKEIRLQFALKLVEEFLKGEK